MVALDNGLGGYYYDPMKQVKFTCPDDLHEAVKVEAARRDRSESSVIRQALRAYLEGKENGK